MRINWNVDGSGCEIGRARFEFVSSFDAKSNADRLVILKGRGMLEQYLRRFAASPPKNALEFGIFEGGSPAFLTLALGIEHFVGIDIRQKIPGFQNWLAAHPEYAMNINVQLGVSQDDAPAVRSIIERRFGSEPLDVIIDDASHFYEQTKAAFEISFPYLKPGGTYIIEDWGWAHWPEDPWQRDLTWRERTPLSKLIFELLMACASAPKTILNVQVMGGAFVAVQKSYDARVGEHVVLDDLIKMQGRAFQPFFD